MMTQEASKSDIYGKILETIGFAIILIGAGHLLAGWVAPTSPSTWGEGVSSGYFQGYGLALLWLGLCLYFRPGKATYNPKTYRLLLFISSLQSVLGLGYALYISLSPTPAGITPLAAAWLIMPATESFLFLILAMAFLLGSARNYRAAALGFNFATLLCFIVIVNFLLGAGGSTYTPLLYTHHLPVVLLQIAVSLCGALLYPQHGLTQLFTGSGLGNMTIRRIFPISVLLITFQGVTRLYFFKNGTFTLEMGLAVAIVLFLTCTLLILAQTARILNRIEEQQVEADKSLKRLNKELERKVAASTQKLKISEEKFHKAFKLCPAGMVLSELSTGKFLEVNDQIPIHTGFSLEETIGQTALEIGLLSKRSIAQTALALRNEGRISHFETTYHCKTGEVKTGLVSSEIIELEDSNCVITVIYDITERIEYEKKTKEIAEAKEQFMANMSHEIRTPMNAIIGFTNLLEGTPQNQEARQYVDYIKTSGENLLVLINDILDYSKIQAGMMVLETTNFKVKDLVQSIQTMFQARAHHKGLKLTLAMDPAIPDFLLGDPTRLTQILTNLIGNAIKFTENGEVHLSVLREPREEERVYLRFSVQDSGIGIPKDKQKEIFDRFVQASPETTRDFGGSGLGLTIVKNLVELLDGTLTLESKPGMGSCFQISLPFIVQAEPVQAEPVQAEPIQAEPVQAESVQAEPIQAEPIQAEPVQAEPVQAEPVQAEPVQAEPVQAEPVQAEHPPIQVSRQFPFEHPVDILLVEDNKLNQILAESFLTKFGCQVTLAPNGLVASELVQERHFDMVLMDIQMPIMDGYTASKLIRKKIGKRLPIIAMTAHAMAGEKEKCLSYGMNDYISKPFDKEDLYRLIEKHAIEKPPHADHKPQPEVEA
ncbi:PAS domain S-box-containing protein [Dyadobacter jejuensis]|uniref:histidine kinase n=1 Tax=Dyadobacter jejuensis TaxID=1082580 RepID=A0A316ANW2_9BACT|nr:ATP-binding protein [Dyadobacter jejuensis]PWJ59232.1 PAS domain S-box-containing protein [Dyadobacter jejuensis]